MSDDDQKFQAIAIDSEAQTVSLEQLSFADAQKFVGGYLEPLYVAEDVVLVDEDARLKIIKHGFALGGWELIGKAVIFGRAGEHFADVRMSLDAVKRAARFWPARDVH